MLISHATWIQMEQKLYYTIIFPYKLDWGWERSMEEKEEEDTETIQ